MKTYTADEIEEAFEMVRGGTRTMAALAHSNTDTIECVVDSVEQIMRAILRLDNKKGRGGRPSVKKEG